MEKTSNRIRYIDIFKGIGILLMILGHVRIGRDLDIYIHAFHMPMFFFISGFLFKCTDFKKFIGRKFKALIIPYLQFGFFNMLMCILLLPDFKILKYLEHMFIFNNHKPLDIAGALWFLTGLFFLNIIFYLIIKFFKEKWTPLICISAVAIVYFAKLRIPLSIDSAIYMLPVFYAGFMFKKLTDKISNVKYKMDIIFGVVLFAIFSLLLFKNGYVNVRGNQYSNIILFYINAICLSVGLFYIAKLLENVKGSKALEYCGRYSLNFMCLNQLVIYILTLLRITNAFAAYSIALLILASINELLNLLPAKTAVRIQELKDKYFPPKNKD